MTRGSFYLFMPNRVLESAEFNGDMYPDGHGDHALLILREVTGEKSFREMIRKFNKENHNYDHKLVFVMKKKSTNFSKGYFDLNNSETCYFSDWLFIKNLSGKSIVFDQANKFNEPIVVAHGETVRFKYGNEPDEKELLTKTLEESGVVYR